MTACLLPGMSRHVALGRLHMYVSIIVPIVINIKSQSIPMILLQRFLTPNYMPNYTNIATGPLQRN